MACVLIILGFRYVTNPSDSNKTVAAQGDSEERGVVEADNTSIVSSPFSTITDVENSDIAKNIATEHTAAEALTTTSIDSVSSTQQEPWPDIDVFNLGRSEISDDDFANLAERLNADPDFLQAVINEFRLETDSERLRRLAQLLGDAKTPEVTALASEMIFSGDPASRKVGLALLKHVQPGNAEARSLVSGLLATEIEADVLVDTLTALSVPGVVDSDARAGMSEQVMLLATHADASVRRSSISILSRWSDDASHTPVILNGLQDEDRYVRQASAYALVGHENQSAEVIQSLLTAASNVNEVQRVRRGAILALKGMTVDAETQSRLVAIEHQLNTQNAN